MVSFETKRDKPVMPQTLCPGREFCMSNWQSSGGNNKFNHKVHKEGLKVRKEIIIYSLRCFVEEDKILTTKFTKMSSKYSKRFLFIAWCALRKNLVDFVVNKLCVLCEKLSELCG